MPGAARENNPAEGLLEAVCLSPGKHTSKEEVDQAELRRGYGLVDDAHAGSRREVSLLALEAIEEGKGKEMGLKPGDFAENLTTSGIELESLPVGTRLAIGPRAVLEIIQIGKKCHNKCEIFKKVGDCVMPRKGIFARVINDGLVRKGDHVDVVLP